jgi:hypothetical protein
MTVTMYANAASRYFVEIIQIDCFHTSVHAFRGRTVLPLEWWVSSMCKTRYTCISPTHETLDLPVVGNSDTLGGAW